MSALVRVAALPLALVLFGGCASVSNLGGGTRYACQAPEGVACESVSATYANTAGRRAPSAPSAPPPDRGGAAPATPRAAGAPPSEGAVAVGESSAIRAPGRILRLWVKPWEDSDGDLHEQGDVHVQVDGGRWLLDHVHRRIREAFAPIRPPQRLLGSDGTTAGTRTTQDTAGRVPGMTVPPLLPGSAVAPPPAGSD